MSVNQKKTKFLLFSKMKTFDFTPEMQLVKNENIEVVEEMKIVGFMLRSDLKTISNTIYIISEAYFRMWTLRRLKALGASRTRLIDILQKQFLSELSTADPWCGGLGLCADTGRENRFVQSVADRITYNLGVRIHKF